MKPGGGQRSADGVFQAVFMRYTRCGIGSQEAHFIVWFFFTSEWKDDKINAQKERQNCARKGPLRQTEERAQVG
jgi:hypothetical protein